VLLVGAVTAGIEFKRHLEWMVKVPAPIFEESAEPLDFVAYTEENAFYIGQYSGSLDSAFFRYAAKPIPATGKAVVGSDEYELNAHDFVLYGNHVYLLRDSVTMPPEVEAGSTFTVPWQLHFFGPSLNGNPIDPTLRLVDDAGAPVWETNSWPGGRPDVESFEMTQWSGVMTVTVPISATIGLYTLEAGFKEIGKSEYLVAHAVPAGDEMGRIVPIGVTEIVWTK
jgi:hypothetical protein